MNNHRQPSAMRTASTGLALALLAGGCGSDSTLSDLVVRDSASVTIVENAVPLWTDLADAWRLEAEPTVTIGVVEGAPEYQLFRVRHALRLEDGMIVVADGGSRELRFYDSDGRHIRSIGRDGEGPGEFRVISLLALYGVDSLAVYDGQLERVSILDRRGTFGRSFRRPDLGTFVYVHGFFRDGSLVGSADQGVNFDTLSTGVLRAHSVVFRLTSEGDIDTIGRFFSGESYVKRAERASISSMPFARQAVRVTDGDSLHYGTSDTYEIRTYTSRGELMRVVRVQRSNTPLTQQDIEAYIDATAVGITDPRRRNEFVASLREMPHAPTLPAYAEMRVDAERNLWVADYLLRADAQTRWTVFDPEGRMLGTIQQPSGLRITDIGADYVLGIVRDDLNVEQVAMYRLIKPKS